MSYDRLIHVAEAVLLSPFDIVGVSRAQRLIGPDQYPEDGTEVVYAGGARVFVPVLEPEVVLARIDRGQRSMNWFPTAAEGDGSDR